MNSQELIGLPPSIDSSAQEQCESAENDSMLCSGIVSDVRAQLVKCEEVDIPPGFDLLEHMWNLESQLIRLAFQESGGDRKKAVKLLGISSQYLTVRMRKFAWKNPKEVPPPDNASLLSDLKAFGSLDELLQHHERKYIFEALARTQGVAVNAAKILGISFREMRTKKFIYSLRLFYTRQ